MANTVEMPKLGFDMAEGKLVKWVKGENEKIEKGDVLAEIETDKATVEVESPFGGVVAKHLVGENSMVPVGSPIAVVIDEGETFDQNAVAPKKSGSSEVMAADQVKPEGEKVTQVEPKKEKVSEVGSQALIENVEKEPSETQDTTEMIKASPLAKRIAKEKGIDLSNIPGSGPGERIVKRDLERAKAPDTKAEVQPKIKAEPSLQKTSGKDEVIEISRLRAAIGKRMLESHQTIPYFTITHSYNAEAFTTLRKELNEGSTDEAKISVNDFFIRAAALALVDFPNLNASISGSQLTRHGAINIGVAVAVENGLLTIVVKNADQKTLPEVSREMKEMAARVRDGKVRNDDIEGSTFTISNLGMFDVEDFTAIINPPEAAILAIGSAMQAPVVKNGTLSVGWRVKATLSADHRITDGAEAARFMQHMALFLEQPWRLL
jgi:pyruvate dehydrogenase E2 component (dihydrolipoamide acetyltransferase)